MFAVDPGAPQPGGGLCESRDRVLYFSCSQAPCMLLNIKQVLMFSKYVGSAFSVRHGMGSRGRLPPGHRLALLLPAGWVTSNNEFTLMASVSLLVRRVREASLDIL